MGDNGQIQGLSAPPLTSLGNYLCLVFLALPISQVPAFAALRLDRHTVPGAKHTALPKRHVSVPVGRTKMSCLVRFKVLPATKN